MSLLFTILRAAHASGTHHKLALDALTHLTGPDAEAWRRVFLDNAKLYMEGAKAPDTEFKDFKNHVLHPGDGYWGGAPEKARNWYQHLVTALQEEKWSEAVWCAGVLSHYLTDPMMPFHTAQSEAENAIHRATEWSINRSYDTLLAEARAAGAAHAPSPVKGDRWLEAYVCDGADASHEHYERLIAHYDIAVGVADPPAGLDDVARRLVGALLVRAMTAHARVLDRAIAEAAVAPPSVSLTAQTILAALAMPAKWLTKRIADAEERRLVEAMYDELKATGRVEKTLPEDDRVVRDLHAREVGASKEAARKAAKQARISGKTGASHFARAGAAASVASTAAATQAVPPTEALASLQIDRSPGPATAPAPQSERAAPKPQWVPPPAAPLPQSQPLPSSESGSPPLAAAAPARPAPVSQAAPSAASTPAVRSPRYRLVRDDEIERAPSIGAKTATRLMGIGIVKVADLIEADPAVIAAGLDDRRITAATVSRWQSEARLVLGVPGLSGTAAQLLVASGYADAGALAAADPVDVSAALLRTAGTSEGQRLLRDGAPPDVEKVKAWVEAAALAEAA